MNAVEGRQKIKWGGKKTSWRLPSPIGLRLRRHE
jgi:hypothetical protein